MGAIKDIVDLCIKLRDENRDGKVSTALSQIQSLTLALQAEQAAIADKNSAIVTENLDLKRKLLNMEESHAKATATLQEGHRSEIVKITAMHSQAMGEALDEISTKMLVTLANFDDTSDGITDGELIRQLGLPKAKGDYHFDQLRSRKLVASGGGQMGRGSFYFVTTAGREYLARAGLL